MIDICISPQINISIDGELDISNLVDGIKNLEIEKIIVKNIIEEINNITVDEYCGKKYTQGNGEKLYQRAKTFKRKIITTVGEIDLKLHQIHDKIKNIIFTPIYEKIDFNQGKNYQNEISMTCTELATKMTYRDTNKEAKLFIEKPPSPTTLQRMVIKHGKEINEFNKEKIKKDYKDEKLEYFFADGTKTHSQVKNKNNNDVNIALGQGKKGEKVYLDLQINKPWKTTKKELDKLNIIEKDACLIADGERELRYALMPEQGFFQMDTIHLIRDTLYKLWQDSKLDLNMRKELKKELESILYYLINSTNKYKNNKKELKIRINECVDKLKEFSKKLIDLGCEKSAQFIKTYSNYAVTYAMLTLESKNIPWNSNIIERLMGEVSKRCKHKWMRWGSEGQEAMLNLILTRYTNPQYYEEYKNKTLKKENLKNIKIKIKII